MFNESLGVGSVITNVAGTLSDYDFKYGEFYLSQFSPGSAINFGNAGGPGYQNVVQLSKGVQLINSLDAYVWKVPSEEAEKVIAIMESDHKTYRKIYARVHFTILEADVEKSVLKARINSYSLYTDPKFPGTEPTRLAEFKF